MPAPAVSVIVPVRDRRMLLGDLLDAMSCQTEPDHEVIVIDDGSSDGSDVEARAHADRDARITVLDGEGRGAVAARRLGVEVAQGRVLAFTDSDCVPAPDWLACGLAHIEAGADLVQGRTEAARVAGPLERTVWVTREDGLYATCNVFYRRSAFDAAGGFDLLAGERLRFRAGRTLRDLGFGEDTLLGWRVRRAGSSRFAPEAVVRHHVFPPDVREAVLRAWNAGGFAALLREVPELRSTLLRRRVLLGDARRLPFYAGAALFATGRRAPGAFALAVWVATTAGRLRRQPGTRRQKMAALPVVVVVDLITAVSLLCGSLRARRVVL